MKFTNHADLNGLQLRNAVLQPLASPPANPVNGQVYYDTALGRMQYRENGQWGHTADNALLLAGQNAGYFLSRANHTGTQPASTISDLAAVVKSYRLDEFAVPTAALNFNGQRLTNVGAPAVDSDAATQGYVKSAVANAAAGIDAKASVRVVATSNISLSGTQTIDGVALSAGDRVLARAQTTASQNGVYVVAAGAWSRATDADENSELTPGAFWFVEEGTTLAKSQWRIENTGTIQVGTTAITINQFGAAVNYSAGDGILFTGSVISIKAKAGGGVIVDSTGVYLDPNYVARKFSGTIGDGSATSFTVTHNLATADVIVQVKDSAGNVVFADVQISSTNAVVITFAVAPASSAYRVTVIG